MRTRTVVAAAFVVAAAAATLVAARPASAPPSALTTEPAVAARPIPAEYDDGPFFLSPIMQAKGEVSSGAVTGITVPHHLLARDLIAGAFRFASAARPRQVLLMSPDHFGLGETDVSVADRDLDTVFGPLATDLDAVRALERLPSVRPAAFFYREHGLQAELPFIRHHFPDAKIVALTFKESTPKPVLDAVVAALEGVIGRDTLVVQSTDFSHYLSAAEAAAKDRETTAVLERGDADAILALGEPSNLDSTAAQYVQTRLQKEFFGSSLAILAHRNSQEYADGPVASTTSYIVQAYVRDR